MGHSNFNFEGAPHDFINRNIEQPPQQRPIPAQLSFEAKQQFLQNNWRMEDMDPQLAMNRQKDLQLQQFEAQMKNNQQLDNKQN